MLNKKFAYDKPDFNMDSTDYVYKLVCHDYSDCTHCARSSYKEDDDEDGTIDTWCKDECEYRDAVHDFLMAHCYKTTNNSEKIDAFIADTADALKEYTGWLTSDLKEFLNSYFKNRDLDKYTSLLLDLTILSRL